MSLEKINKASRKVVGLKQALRVIKSGEAKAVFIAQDAEKHIVGSLIEESESKGIQVIMTDDMVSLGKACGIKVGASVAAILED